jgi:hypothetical protein
MVNSFIDFINDNYCKPLDILNKEGYKLSNEINHVKRMGYFLYFYEFKKGDSIKHIRYISIYSGQADYCERNRITPIRDGTIQGLDDQGKIESSDWDDYISLNDDPFRIEKDKLLILPLPDIKALCKENKVKRTGTKSELVNRIINNKYHSNNLVT